MLTVTLALLIFVAVASASRQPHDRDSLPGTCAQGKRETASACNEKVPVADATLRSAHGRDAGAAGAHVNELGSPPRSVRVMTQTRPTVSRERFNAMRHLAYVRGRRVKQLKRVLLARPSVAEAINLAAAAYRVDAGTLWRKARCESGLNPNARNGSEASGLFQFLPSTFASTPFGRFSIWSPYANALAAGWMHSVGRGGEWVCR